MPRDVQQFVERCESPGRNHVMALRWQLLHTALDHLDMGQAERSDAVAQKVATQATRFDEADGPARQQQGYDQAGQPRPAAEIDPAPSAGVAPAAS